MATFWLKESCAPTENIKKPNANKNARGNATNFVFREEMTGLQPNKHKKTKLTRSWPHPLEMTIKMNEDIVWNESIIKLFSGCR